jgi:hypothetical protein
MTDFCELCLNDPRAGELDSPVVSALRLAMAEVKPVSHEMGNQQCFISSPRASEGTLSRWSGLHLNPHGRLWLNLLMYNAVPQHWGH